MIIGEGRIHNYTHTNYRLNTLNIKYYKFGSSFDTTEFYRENVNVDVKMLHSMI
jgi:hypothetical protein